MVRKKPKSTKPKTDLRAALAHGLVLHGQGKSAEARDHFQGLLRIHPEDFDVLQLTASIESSLGNKQTAVSLFDKAIRYDQSNASVYFNYGNTLKDLGRHAEAVKAYEKSLAITPHQPKVLNNLGIALTQIGQYEPAIRAYESALAIDGHYAQTRVGLGMTLGLLERFDEAIRNFQGAIDLDPQLVEAHYLMGIALLKQDQLKLALNSFSKTTKLDPNHALAHCNMGLTLTRLGWQEEALHSYTKAVECNPNFAEALNNQGVALNDLKRFKEAIPCYDRAIELNPQYSDAHYNRGIALFELKQFEAALLEFKATIALSPNFKKAFHNMGATLKSLKRYEEALDSYEQAIKIDPLYVDAYVNKGELLNEMDRVDEALGQYETALRIQPNYAIALVNRGILYADLRDYEQAMLNLNQALTSEPGLPKALFNRGLVNLRTRRLEEGFSDCRSRWALDEFREQLLKSPIPPLAPGETNKSVLLWAEQGLGDEVLHYGLLEEFLQLGHKVTLMADKRLHAVIRRSFPEMELLDRRILTLDVSIKDGYDRQIAIADLGYILGIDEARLIASRKPYLRVCPERRQDISGLISKPESGLVCGIAWRSQNDKFGARKSLRLLDFKDLLQTPNVHFVNLQYGSVQHELADVKQALGIDVQEIKEIDIYNDIDGLLALIDQCDVVVTTSNVTAHLAGAIGKKTAVLPPYSKGRLWYWHESDGPSPWYPSLELFSPTSLQDWEGAIRRAKHWLNGAVGLID